MGKIKEFVDLHQHSTYSFLDAYGTSEQIVKQAIAMGRKSIAITDHGNISAYCSFEQTCIKEKLKLIFGCEFYCSDKEKPDNRYHLTVLAKNLIGYSNILSLVTLAWENSYQHYSTTYPILKSSHLLQHKEGLIILSGCLEGKISKMIIQDNHKEAVRLIDCFYKEFPNFYLEIQPFTLVDTIKVNKFLFQIAKERKIPMVLTNDVHYPTVDGQESRLILRAIRARKNIKDMDPDTQDMSILSYDTLYNRMVNLYPDNAIQIIQSMENSVKISSMCDSYRMPKTQFIQFDIPNKVEYFKKLCYDGLKARNKYEPEYIDRLNIEIDLIINKNFIDYFLLVYDIIDWGKKHNKFFGPSRGSSGGSLVCWALNITEVDSIRHNLLFERFLDITRTDYPDIDVDICDEDREEVFRYISDKYGVNKVAHVGAFAKFKGKNSLDEVGKVYNIPSKDVETIKSLLLERSIADSRASFTIQDTINKFSQAQKVSEKYPDIIKAEKLEGQCRHLTIHAAGVVIANEPLDQYVAVYTKNTKDKTEKVISFDKDEASYLGFVKMDLLGLKTMTVLRNICNVIGWKYKDLIDKISLDDKKTLEGFAKGDVFGIFQYEGRTATSLIKHIKPDNFDIVKDVNALIRPGPLYSRDTSNYISIRKGQEQLIKKKEHPIVAEITKNTFGQILYQEQVMKIVKNIGNFSWEDTAKIRKAMSKSLGDEYMSGFKEKFVKGAMENGLNNNEAVDIWTRINSHGSWSFNEAHAVGYAILAFWAMYMKQHYHTEFYWSSLMLENDDNYKARMMIEFDSKGGKLLPPRLNYSQPYWSIEGDAIRAGLMDIKGIGEKTAIELSSHYPYQDIKSISEKATKRIVNSRIIKIIENSNLLDKKVSTAEFQAFKDYKNLNSVDVDCKIKDIDYFVRGEDLTSKPISIACFVREKMLYNIHEEDKIQDRARVYKNPEIADYMVLTLQDFTDTVKARMNRFVYAKYKDELQDIGNNDIIKVVCKVSDKSRVVNVLSIEKVK